MQHQTVSNAASLDNKAAKKARRALEIKVSAEITPDGRMVVLTHDAAVGFRSYRVIRSVDGVENSREVVESGVDLPEHGELRFLLSGDEVDGKVNTSYRIEGESPIHA
jgi:hypothetical protein